MNALGPIADKLGKLVRLLTSDRDGEVVAAARGINRTLKNAGLDIHVLAAAIEQSGGQPAGQYTANDERPKWAGGEQTDWHAVASECAAHPNRLRDQREKDFVADMVAWTELGGQPTEKQAKWLRAIYLRVRPPDRPEWARP